MIVRVVACVISRSNKLLVCRRPLSKRHGGLWEFPGGKVEPGESDEDAVRRELLEELGIHLNQMSDSLFTIADPNSPYVISFIPVAVHGEATCHEHTDMRWNSLEELNVLPLAPSDRSFVDFLINRVDS